MLFLQRRQRLGVPLDDLLGLCVGAARAVCGGLLSTGRRGSATASMPRNRRSVRRQRSSSAGGSLATSSASGCRLLVTGNAMRR